MLINDEDTTLVIGWAHSNEAGGTCRGFELLLIATFCQHTVDGGNPAPPGMVETLETMG